MSMLHISLWLIYFFIALALMRKSKRMANSGLSINEVTVLFTVQILMGLAVGLVTYRLHASKDYWALHQEGLAEYRLLITNPGAFCKSILYSPYQDSYGNYFNAVGSYWNDLRNNLLTKTLAICNIFSRGDYYINSLFFNCLGFWGHWAFFSLFRQVYPGKKYTLIFTCFLIPSLLFYTSGIHKDLVVFSCLGFFVKAMYDLAHSSSFRYKHLLQITISFIVLLLIRNFLAMLLIPLTASYYWTEKRKWNPLISFSGILIILLIYTFFADQFQIGISPVSIIAQRQYDFMQLRVAHSSLHLTPLSPGFAGIVANFPEAINHAFLRPYPWEASSVFALLLSIELWSFLILLLIGMIKKITLFGRPRPIIIYGLLIAVLMFIITGYIIPNSNSIIRYKSLYLPLFITPFLSQLNFKLIRINL